MRLKTVLFDFDGTLANTRDDVWSSVAYAAEGMGGSVPSEFSDTPSNVALPEDAIFKAVCPHQPECRLEEFQSRIRQHYRKLNAFPKTAFYPGIQKLLTTLNQRGINCRIITLKPLEALERLLTVKGWSDYFASWLSPDSFGELPVTKDELIKRCIAGENREDFIYVGDSYSDIFAARENGILSLGVTYGDGDCEKLLKAKPDYVCNLPEHLEDAILNLEYTRCAHDK